MCNEEVRKNLKVVVTYFKCRGKYYADAEYYSKYSSKDPFYKFWDELREKFSSGEMPGLIDGDFEESGLIVSIDVPDHPHRHPRLIVSKKMSDVVTIGEN